MALINNGATLYGGQWTGFNLTNMVKSWKAGAYPANVGFVMASMETGDNSTFLSSEYPTTSYRPYVVMTYDPTAGEEFDNPKLITLNTSYTINIDTQNELIYFKFVPSSTGFYVFESDNIVSGDPKAWLYNSNQTLIQIHDDIYEPYNTDFRLVQHLEVSKEYYFVAGCYGTGTGSYSAKLSKVSTSSYLNTTTISWGSTVNVSCATIQKPILYKITPSVSGEYLFYSSNSVGDPKVWVYNSNFVLVDDDDNTAGNSNFSVCINLTAEQIYYIVAGHASTETGNYTLEAYRSLNYVNYYDSSFASNPTLVGKIDEANEFANYVYSTCFGIKMNMDGSASQYATVADNCSTGMYNNCNDSLCGTMCDLGHHKNIFTIALQLYNDPREDNHLYVLWTDRQGGAYCIEDDYGQHATTSSLAVVCSNWPVIHFMYAYGSNSDVREACMSLCLVHETAHTLNMHEVYNTSGHDKSGTVCVMEKFDPYTAYSYYQDVLNGNADPFCESCMQTMRQLTSSSAIQGN